MKAAHYFACDPHPEGFWDPQHPSIATVYSRLLTVSKKRKARVVPRSWVELKLGEGLKKEENFGSQLMEDPDAEPSP